MAAENLTLCIPNSSSSSMENKPKRPKLKIIPPRRPDDDLTPDEVFAVQALLMLANGQSGPIPSSSSSLPPNNSRDHECKTCGMVFKSHQALGGHQTTHRAPKNIIINNNNNNNNIVMNTSTHSCSICNKVFPSGQALGGHKRKHYDRDHQESSDATASCSNVSDFASNRHRGLNIDLNFPPAPEFS